eukprot:gene1068-2637_t
MSLSSHLIVGLAAAGAALAGPSPPAMPNLLLPPWEPTWDMTCFGPTKVTTGKDPSGRITGPAPPLTPDIGEFLRHWGIVALDFESQGGDEDSRRCKGAFTSVTVLGSVLAPAGWSPVPAVPTFALTVSLAQPPPAHPTPLETTWGQHSPKDADVMMLEQVAIPDLSAALVSMYRAATHPGSFLRLCQLPDGSIAGALHQAAAMKAIAPNTQVWVYRNLAQGYSNFVQLRALLDDPARSDWWLPFAPNATTHRCELNPRLNKTLCTDRFHSKLAWTEDGHDCGDHVPCGDYAFNHRNRSLREWLVQEHMLGPMGMGHPAVDGYLIDDWYDEYAAYKGQYGPSEIYGFVPGTGIPADSEQMKQLWGNCSETTLQALRAVRAAGGFTWSGVNCMLDTDGGVDPVPHRLPLATRCALVPVLAPGYGSPPSDLAGCGLHKTEGVPRADAAEDAPYWHGRGKGWDSSASCSAWTRRACSKDSVFSKPRSAVPKSQPCLLCSLLRSTAPQIPTMIAYGNSSSLHGDVAQFLLTRGPYGYMGYGWHGCVNWPPPSNAYDYDYGEPEGLCTETSPGVFFRKWTKAAVQFDCNTMTPNITLDGHSVPVVAREVSGNPASF